MKPVDVKDTLKAFYNFKNKQKAFDLFISLICKSIYVLCKFI